MFEKKVFENAKSLLVALVIAFIIRSFIMQSFHIPSGSMIPTLLVHDFIVVDKVTYHFRKPDRGDVVVFRFPLNEDVYYIKRIVGVPGDRIQLKGGVLYINDKPVKLLKFEADLHTVGYALKGRGFVYKELLPDTNGSIREHLILRTFSGNAGSENTDEFVVPEGKYFMMGDNRDNSYDSRYWGFVDKSEIVGLARVIFFSWDSSRHMPRFSRLGRLIN